MCSIVSSSFEDTQALEQLVTVRDFAAFLHVSEQTVRYMVHRGELPAIRVSKFIYINRDEFFEGVKKGEYHV